MIYLRTDFFTAINHIPDREFVLQILFKKDTNKVIKNGNWGFTNKNQISIQKILKKKCIRSLVYFKKAMPEVSINEKMFKCDSDGKILRGLYSNEILISVYEIEDHVLKYFESNRRYSSYTTSKLLYSL